MKIFVLVNSVGDLTHGTTTTRLIDEAFIRGNDVYVGGVDDLSVSPDDTVTAVSRRLMRHPTHEMAFAQRLAPAPVRIVLDGCDLVLIRTSPGRDPDRAAEHRLSLALARLLRDRGIQVYNDPVGLQRASSKLYLVHVPEDLRPQSLITRDPEALREFAEGLGAPCVLKPLVGSQGSDVFLLRPGQRDNHDQIIDVLVRRGYVVAQEYLQEATAGDVRLLVLDGAMLEVGGEVAAVRRLPGRNSFRSNIHSGGHAEPTPVSTALREATAVVGPLLMKDGIRFAGLDFVGNRLVEVNVFSTGGLVDAERFYGVDFAAAVLDRLGKPAAVR